MKKRHIFRTKTIACFLLAALLTSCGQSGSSEQASSSPTASAAGTPSEAPTEVPTPTTAPTTTPTPTTAPTPTPDHFGTRQLAVQFHHVNG